MLLDASLGLGIAGLIILPLLLLGLPVIGFVLYRVGAAYVRLRREGEAEQSWLTLVLFVLLCAPVVALVAANVADWRTDIRLVLDLRQPRHVVLAELSRCATDADTACDTEEYAVTARVILSDGKGMTIETRYLRWYDSAASGGIAIEIADANAKRLPLRAAQQLLMRHVAMVAPRPDAATQREIGHASAWLLQYSKDSQVYSDTLGIQLTRQFGLQFHKNVDEVAVTCLLKH